jgi:hypothetical protein
LRGNKNAIPAAHLLEGKQSAGMAGIEPNPHARKRNGIQADCVWRTSVGAAVEGMFPRLPRRLRCSWNWLARIMSLPTLGSGLTEECTRVNELFEPRKVPQGGGESSGLAPFSWEGDSTKLTRLPAPSGASEEGRPQIAVARLAMTGLHQSNMCHAKTTESCPHRGSKGP